MLRQVAIVGASLAGVSAADKLRSLGYDGKLLLIGAEKELPYDRPPLSKQVLADDGCQEAPLLRPAQHYVDQDIDLCLGMPAQALDARSRSVVLTNGSCYSFDGLVIACGAGARTLSSAKDLAGVHVLRTMEDSVHLRLSLQSASEVVVIGAGLIGAEVASTARTLGLSVTLVEAGRTPMPRIVGPRVGEYLAAVYCDHGVQLRLGCGVTEFVGADRVEAVRLSEGSVVPADLVVLGIGAEPAIGWLKGSGVPLSDGVTCDEYCSAGPHIYAAGDVARWHDREQGTHTRLEHWTNAVEQGETVAENMLGGGKRYTTDGYFWSDQFGRKIQVSGHVSPNCSEVIYHKDRQCRQLLALYGRSGRLSGAVTSDWPKMQIVCRRLIAEKTSWERSQIMIAESLGEPALT